MQVREGDFCRVGRLYPLPPALPLVKQLDVLNMKNHASAHNEH